MKTGDKAKIDPKVTGKNNWVEGIIINIRNNPFLGKEIAIKDNNGIIYFEAAKYFKLVSK